MQTITVFTARQTKYSVAVLEALHELKHATNNELLSWVQGLYPEVTATTVHRVTARLKQRGIIGYAPKPVNGSERYDFNQKPHHHFMCSSCSRVCDVEETSKSRTVIAQLKELSKDCALAGTLTMQGICKRCVN